MADSPGIAKPKHPDALPPANVHVLHPDGTRIVKDGSRHWLERRRGGRSVAAVAFDMGELMELREVLNRYLKGFEEP